MKVRQLKPIKDERGLEWIPLAKACELVPSPISGEAISSRTLRRWIREGRLLGKRIGERYWWVRKDQVLAFRDLTEPLPKVATVRLLRPETERGLKAMEEAGPGGKRRTKT